MDELTYPEIIPLKIIEGPLGDVRHILKSGENQFIAFGEAYFSTVNFGAIKGWKKHTRMQSNIVIATGEVKFVLYDARENSRDYGKTKEITLSPIHYQRLTIPSGIWFAFMGTGKEQNLLLNIASILHDPTECENLPLENNYIPYKFF